MLVIFWKNGKRKVWKIWKIYIIFDMWTSICSDSCCMCKGLTQSWRVFARPQKTIIQWLQAASIAELNNTGMKVFEDLSLSKLGPTSSCLVAGLGEPSMWENKGACLVINRDACWSSGEKGRHGLKETDCNLVTEDWVHVQGISWAYWNLGGNAML